MNASTEAPARACYAVDTARRVHRARLSWRDLVEVTAACVALARIEWSLRHEPLAATASRCHVALAADTTPGCGGRPALPLWAKTRGALALAVLRRAPVADTCLRRALLLGHRWAALSPTLVIGVRETDGLVAAHAWLRIDGIDLDPTAPDFAVLPIAASR